MRRDGRADDRGVMNRNHTLVISALLAGIGPLLGNGLYSGAESTDGRVQAMPHMLAGTRIEPPMSLPCATGTYPAATAAPEPPLEPPAV